MEEKKIIQEMIDYYTQRIREIDSCYFFSQDKDRKLINFKKRSKVHTELKSVYEDFLADLTKLLEPAAKEPTDLTKTEPMEERDNITIICGWLGGNTPRAIAARKFMDGLLEEIHKLSHPAEEQEYPLMCRECGRLKKDDGNLICLCPKEPITAEEVPCYNCKETECRCVEDTEIDCVLKLVNDYWKFDNNQQPMSSWHDKQDLLKAIAKIGSK